MQKRIGYVRVSSKDQNEARQLESMKEQGVSERDIFIDKQSGKDFDRESYQLMKRMLRAEDTLYVHSLDRLGRNKEMILNEWQDITKRIKANIVVIDMPLLDTRKYNDSIGSFVADLVLQVLSWVAEEERDRIRKRQREGIDTALQNGTQFGRPKASVDETFISAYKEWKAGTITGVEATKRAKVKKTTFYKLVKAYEATI